MKTIALELTNHEDGFLNDKKYLIMDGDATFSQSFRDFLRKEGVKPVRLPPRSPNLNAHLERFFGSLKDVYSCYPHLSGRFERDRGNRPVSSTLWTAV